jgi:hypothetical protein
MWRFPSRPRGHAGRDRRDARPDHACCRAVTLDIIYHPDWSVTTVLYRALGRTGLQVSELS